jgi:hypothetical protein
MFPKRSSECLEVAYLALNASSSFCGGSGLRLSSAVLYLGRWRSSVLHCPQSVPLADL